MTITVALTGFGPFPGAPYNPTGPLVEALAGARAHAGVKRRAHVFPTTYAAVDKELPSLIARERPDALLMFGLAQRSRHLRIETCAHNRLTCLVPDAGGDLPMQTTIAPDAPETLSLAAPAHRLAVAARAAGLPAFVSHDAGRYLCNYICWRACELASQSGSPRLIAFVHVPAVARSRGASTWRPGLPFILSDLERAGEAIVQAAIAAVRARR
jgi:pyroglutamyl-peptidase